MNIVLYVKYKNRNTICIMYITNKINLLMIFPCRKNRKLRVLTLQSQLEFS